MNEQGVGAGVRAGGGTVAGGVMVAVYLDVCCLNRPFDDWVQERVRLEGDSVL